MGLDSVSDRHEDNSITCDSRRLGTISTYFGLRSIPRHIQSVGGRTRRRSHYLLGRIYLDARCNGRSRASGTGLNINVACDWRSRVRFHPLRATHVHGISPSGG